MTAAPLVYLDNNATTPLDPYVLEVMTAHLRDRFGNPSSLHPFGARVAADIENARVSVARLIGARPPEIIFNSGGTEANNAALHGVLAARPDRRHVIISATEHHAISEPAACLERGGVEVTVLPVDGNGHPSASALRGEIRPDTALVSLMLANNETGVISPVAELARMASERGVIVHSDAINAAGKTPIRVDELGVHLLSLSAHKIHGPKGVGALYVRSGTPWQPTLRGGPQERERRGGTQNTSGIVGFGAACEMLNRLSPDHLVRVAALRDRLEAGVIERFPEARVVGRNAPRLPNTACVCFPGTPAEPLLLALGEAGVCVSSGSACSSGSLHVSHVLRAMGIDEQLARGQIRFSLSRFTTDTEIERALSILPEAVKKASAFAFSLTED